MKLLARSFEKALFDYDSITVEKIFGSIDNDADRIEFINTAFVGTLEKLGRDWENGCASLSQVYMCGKICEGVIEKLDLKKAAAKNCPKKIAVVTLEDQHRLGKRMVTSILRSSGYDFIDYGHGVLAEDLVKRTTADRIDILLISVLMLPSSLKIKGITEALKNELPSIVIAAGGAPFTLDRGLYAKLGLDAFGTTAFDAVKIIENATGGGSKCLNA